MRFYTLCGLAATVAALPGQLRRDDGFKAQPWAAAGPGDSRGPCPMMNTLANHGYLPHSGRNITVAQFGAAVHAATGWSDQVGLIPARGAFAALGATTTIDLEDLNNRPSGLERPASLARADDSNDVVPARVAAVLADSADPKYLTAASLGRSRHRVEATSPLTPAQQSPAQGEAGFILALMLDGTVPDAAAAADVDYTQLRAFKDRTEEWLTFERLPVDLGWRPSSREVTFADLAPINAAIKKAQAEVN